jgi:hypothetical protein
MGGFSYISFVAGTIRAKGEKHEKIVKGIVSGPGNSRRADAVRISRIFRRKRLRLQ